eukprot:TRINITY_DN6536_c1_g1_i1.p1 TRINITY_DN6536_c1_g1~~TRINITY_DN6536_c1_g1_i1.p1  ORF type:complete len:290 (+),score=72.61 TRINITY_DN6536_c1_g1_i1:47-916(+)
MGDPWSNALHNSMKQLRKVADAVGVEDEEIAAAKGSKSNIDTSRMTGYEKKQYQCADLMSEVRNDISILDDKDKSAKLSDTTKIMMKNRVRRNLAEIKKTMNAQETVGAAKKEGKNNELAKLRKHFKATEKMWKQRYTDKRFLQDDCTDENTPLMGGGNAGDSIQELTPHDPVANGPLLDPAEDEEFMVFYEQSKERDLKIDQALERVHASLQRLKQNAVSFQDELVAQNALLDQVNEKAAQRAMELRSLNKKLKGTLRDVNKSNLCCYVICFIMLLGVMGVIYTQVLK